VRQGSFSWWPKWPASSPVLASTGLFCSKLLVPPGSPSMSQGGPCLGSPGAVSLRTNGAPSCAAHTPARGVFRGAHCGPRLPSDGLSGGSGGSASSPCLHVPSLRASRGCVPSAPVSFCDGSSGGSGLLSLSNEPSQGGGSGGGISGARFGPLSLACRPSRSGSNSASSPRLPVPIAGPSCGSDPSLPESGRGNDGGGVGGGG
jgi:hypothetical protein